jgi:hypothetical protein
MKKRKRFSDDNGEGKQEKKQKVIDVQSIFFSGVCKRLAATQFPVMPGDVKVDVDTNGVVCMSMPTPRTLWMHELKDFVVSVGTRFVLTRIRLHVNGRIDWTFKTSMASGSLKTGYKERLVAVVDMLRGVCVPVFDGLPSDNDRWNTYGDGHFHIKGTVGDNSVVLFNDTFECLDICIEDHRDWGIYF